MTSFTSSFSLNVRGEYVAETVVPLCEVPYVSPSEQGGTRSLILSTSKRSSGGITSHASVYVINNDGPMSCRTHMFFQDYSKAVLLTPCKRVTEKAVEAAHKAALELLPAVLDEARKQYGLPDGWGVAA